ncbi:hypothetical protein RB653_006204 [Dictyostelium firmibasis]|uniref:Uncharacterized protein n=1 Tax=Dictyostelium firmibasis TaxID=79012 RepID=A0AAN7UBM6_9MYCE
MNSTPNYIQNKIIKLSVNNGSPLINFMYFSKEIQTNIETNNIIIKQSLSLVCKRWYHFINGTYILDINSTRSKSTTTIDKHINYDDTLEIENFITNKPNNSDNIKKIKINYKIWNENNNFIEYKEKDQLLINKFQNWLLNYKSLEKVTINCSDTIKDLEFIKFLIDQLENSSKKIIKPTEINKNITTININVKSNNINTITKNNEYPKQLKLTNNQQQQKLIKINNIKMNLNKYIGNLKQVLNNKIDIEYFKECLIDTWGPSHLILNQIRNEGDEFNGYKFHSNEYSSLFKFETLKHLSIGNNDYLDLIELINGLKGNNHLKSFEVFLDLSIHLESHDHSDTGYYCNCDLIYLHHITPPLISSIEDLESRNTYQHWFEFCNILSNNSTLKAISLKNYCSYFYETENDRIETIPKDCTNKSASFQNRSQLFASIWLKNYSIVYLSLVSFPFLSNEFYLNINRFNKTLIHITLGGSTIKTKESIKDLNQFIMDNQSIKSLSIWNNNTIFYYNDLSSGLRLNKTIKQFEIFFLNFNIKHNLRLRCEDFFQSLLDSDSLESISFNSEIESSSSNYFNHSKSLKNKFIFNISNYSLKEEFNENWFKI